MQRNKLVRFSWHLNRTSTTRAFHRFEDVSDKDLSAMAATANDGEGTFSGWAHVEYRSAAEIRSNASFKEAHDCLVDGLLSLYGQNRVLLRGLMEFVRAVSFMVIVCLDALHDAENPSTWVTLARLRTSLKAMGIDDARRVANIVNGLELDGFLKREVSPVDRRIHILKPTEKMLATDREWLAVFHAPLALLYPGEPALEAAIARDPTYQAAYRRVSLSTLGVADQISRNNPIIGFFLSRNVGIRVLMALAATVRGRSPARTPPGFYTAAAERAGVSRTHVSNLMREAAERGLVLLSNPAGEYVEMLPALQEALAQWIADSLSGVDLVSTLAMDEMRR
jgi:DNA-binding MarR family transcriptional regulator